MLALKRRRRFIGAYNAILGGAVPLYTITGTVYDSDGTTAVQSATVALGALSATSAADGTYTISDVPAGTSGSMTCTKAGYIWTAITVSAMSGNLTGQNYTNAWWAYGGISANCLAAFQPFGAASYATSKVNLTGVSANDAADGPAYPGWAANTGWAFTAASSQYLTVGSGALVTSVPLTFACLFQANDVATPYSLMAIRRSSTSGEGWAIQADGATAGDPVKAVCVQAGVGTSADKTGFTASTWYTAVGVYSANNARAVYLNGTNKGTNTNAKTPAAVDITLIGCSHNGTVFNVFLDGKIGACGLWNMAASDAQVAALSAAMLALVA